MSSRGPLLALLLAAPSARALTLTDAVRRAWASSPSLGAQIDAQQGLARLADGDRWRRFLPNEPQLNWASNDDRTSSVVGVSETFAFPGKSLALTRLDAAKSAAAWAEWRSRRHDAAKAAAGAYLDCAAGAASVGLLKSSLADLESLDQTLKVRYQNGLSALAETISTELQIKQQRADLSAAEDRAALACRRLGALIGSPAAADELPDDVEPALLVELGDLTADESRARSAGALADAARGTAAWAQLPDVTVSAARNHYLFQPGSPNGSAYTWSYGLSVAVPVFAPVSEAAEAARARRQAESDRAAAELARVAATADRLDAARDFRRTRSRLKELRESDLLTAQTLVESAYTAYKTGKLGFAELVLARKTMLDLRTQDIQLRGQLVADRLRCLTRCESLEETDVP